MFNRTVSLMFAMAATLPGFAHADPLEYPINIVDGPLIAGLKALENQTGIELLYDGNLVRELRSPAVYGKLSTEAALHQMLSETDLIVRRAASGAWIIESRNTQPLGQHDVAVAEILVVGRRTQNADIRRIEDDVQPYTVSTQEEIINSHRDNVDQFLSSRVTSNTTIVSSLASQDAGVMSSINLRGLSDLDTVVLLDGRRMPSIPNVEIGFRQSDLNAIPPHAIERIEVLTGAAGGIYGFGALGGVVNVVLDREMDGFEFHASQGITSRGDSHRHGAEASFGRIFGDGATDFMLFASYQELDTLRVGDRRFAVRDYRRTYELAPAQVPLYFPPGNSLIVESLLGTELTFKPEFGGGPLGSDHTWLPIGFSGDAAALVTALRQHANDVDFSVSASEALYDLGSNPQSSALLANLRHEFGSSLEAYADLVLLRNQGESAGPFLVTLGGGQRTSAWSGSALIFPDSPANPFADYISVRYPILDLNGSAKRRLDNSRFTAGLEANLPFHWRGTVEAGWGRLRYSTSMHDALTPSGISLLLFGDPSDLQTNPLGDWETFDRALKRSVLRSTLDEVAETRFHTQSVRLAGPVFETPVGPAMLTLLVENRSEHVPPSKEIYTLDVNGVPSVHEFRDDPLSRRIRSYYGELRSRLVDESARVRLIRGLEVQLAVRRDEQEDHFQRSLIVPDAGMLHSSFTGSAYTLGAKISPTQWLMIRGSYATGQQPPPLENLVESDPFTLGSFGVTDAKRGNTEPDPNGVLLVGGNSELKTTLAKTLFFGVVLSPAGPDGPRLALDYSRIRRTRDVRQVGIDYILAHQDQWPERVQRAPLTEEDRGNGYIAGLIEMIDVRDSNDGMMQVNAFDLRAEWPTTLFDGRLRLYADATYHKSNVRATRYEEEVQWAGYLAGPLKRRANGGFDWSKDRVTIGANLQYLGSSLIYSRVIPGLLDEDDLLLQGSARIPSQTYLDVHGSWRLPIRDTGAVDSLTFDIGLINVLDKSPPRESTAITNGGPGYSRYGDPRQRRFEMGVSCRF